MEAKGEKDAEIKDICIVVMVGSEFAMKGMTALNVLGLPYTTYHVSLTDLKTRLPSPNEVPVICYGDEYHFDSTEIMRFLDSKVFI
jgi:glutathione S-transferase